MSQRGLAEIPGARYIGAYSLLRVHLKQWDMLVGCSMENNVRSPGSKKMFQGNSIRNITDREVDGVRIGMSAEILRQLEEPRLIGIQGQQAGGIIGKDLAAEFRANRTGGARHKDSLVLQDCACRIGMEGHNGATKQISEVDHTQHKRVAGVSSNLRSEEHTSEL